MRVCLRAACAGLCLLAFFMPSLRGDGPGSATKKPVVVQRKTFDPEHRPKEMTDDEDGICVAYSECSATYGSEVLYRKKTDSGAEVAVKIPDMHVTIALTITIYLPVNAPQWMKDHEEGHRQIDETIYAAADKAALAAAKNCAGRTFIGTGPNAAAAEKDALRQAQKLLIDDYTAHAPAVWDRVNQIYDKITKHGANSLPTLPDPIDPQTAIRQAFAQYARESAAAATQATQPATQKQ